MVSNMLTGHAQLDFWHDDCLPEVINGDMEMLLLAVKTLAEFSLKFSVPAERVIVRSALERLSGDDDCYDVSFSFSVAVNPKFDHERVCQMIGVNDPFGLGSNTNDINNFLLQLPKDKYIINNINFSARTTSNQTQDVIFSKLDR